MKWKRDGIQGKQNGALQWRGTRIIIQHRSCWLGVLQAYRCFVNRSIEQPADTLETAANPDIARRAKTLGGTGQVRGRHRDAISQSVTNPLTTTTQSSRASLASDGLLLRLFSSLRFRISISANNLDLPLFR